jgi:AraC-like DNA-binding protein
MSREQYELPFPDLPRLSHFGYSDSVSTYEFGPHYHYGYEFIFITEGKAEIELFINEDPVLLKQDDLCLISPKIIHEFIYDKQTISFFWMGFQTESQIALTESHMQPPNLLIQKKKRHKVKYFTLIDEEINSLTDMIKIENYSIFEKVPYFETLFSQINDEIHNKDQYSSRIVYQKILEIFTRVARIISEDKTVENAPLNYLKTYIENHCRDKIDLADISKKAGYTQEHLSRLFKSKYGRSPKKYHNEKRFNAARQYLAKDASVEDTAYHCGFTSSSYFSTWFKKLSGTAPQDY